MAEAVARVWAQCLLPFLGVEMKAVGTLVCAREETLRLWGTGGRVWGSTTLIPPHSLKRRVFLFLQSAATDLSEDRGSVLRKDT